MRNIRPAAFLVMMLLLAVIVPLSAALSLDTARDEPLTPIKNVAMPDRGKVLLGARLFRDPRLSFDGRKSCMACHDLSSNGATAARTDTPRGVSFPFNTPTLFNVSLNFRLNWEGDLRTVDEQIARTLFGSGRKTLTPESVSARLAHDPVIAPTFRAVYHRPIDANGVVDALSRYIETLRTPGARFDRWLEGDSRAITAQELRGYERFKSLGCVSCHQGVNVGGNMYQRHGIFHPLAAPLPAILRVPSLRNVVTTAPYFHDGSAPTLRDAVRSMGRGQLDLALTDPEIDDLVAFLGTLTGQHDGVRVSAARS